MMMCTLFKKKMKKESAILEWNKEKYKIYINVCVWTESSQNSKYIISKSMWM